MPIESRSAPGLPPPSYTSTFARAAVLAAGVLAFLVATSLQAQVTAEDYARAEAFLGWNAVDLVAGDQVSPVWLEDDRFWFRNRLHEGAREFILVDPEEGTREPAFDHARLARALSGAMGEEFEAARLPFDSFRFVDDETAIRFDVAESGRWRCDIVEYRCAGPEAVPPARPGELASPDGRWVAFIRDHDLWIRSTETAREKQVSHDGDEHYGYGTFTERRDLITRIRTGRVMPPVVAWSPDSRRILTHRLDERHVRSHDLWETRRFGPVRHTYRYALSVDATIPRFQLHVFDLESGHQVPFETGMQDMTELPMWDGDWPDVAWTPSGDEVVFVRGHRGFQRYDVLVADARTGRVRSLFTETTDTFLRLLPWHVTEGGRDLIWVSERDGWAHLYRFDLASGSLRNRITAGTGNVLDIVRVDEEGDWIYFTAVGMENDRDPYFRHLYRARLDGSETELLTSENADHQVNMSPSGRFVVTTHSRRDAAPVTVVRSADGTVVQTVEEADVSRLLAAGWRWPVPFTAKGRDGETDVYGLLYFPPEMEEGATYPVVDYTYPGPQVGPIGFRNFTHSPRGNPHALAELGFIVFTVDAMGTPHRSKGFQEAWFGNMGDHGLPDHIAALRELAEVYPQIDLDRVGIFGHSGGGFASTGALLQYPDFFRVAVSTAGNHDNRAYGYHWAERWQGLYERRPDGSDNYENQSNPDLAHRLEGRLLLMYGTLDDRVHPNANLLLIDELIRHNKDFDLVVLPNRNHGFSNEPYVIRRTWDYFVTHLMGEKPPTRYEIREPN
jgi:dipeptidyl-peptidase 4